MATGATAKRTVVNGFSSLPKQNKIKNVIVEGGVIISSMGFFLASLGFYKHFFHFRHFSLIKGCFIVLPAMACGYSFYKLLTQAKTKRICLSKQGSMYKGYALGILNLIINSLAIVIGYIAFNVKHRKFPLTGLIIKNYIFGFLITMVGNTNWKVINESFGDKLKSNKDNFGIANLLDIYLTPIWLNLHVFFECIIPMLGFIKSGTGLSLLMIIPIMGYAICNYTGHHDSSYPTAHFGIGTLPHLISMMKVAAFLSVYPVYFEFFEHIELALSLFTRSKIPVYIFSLATAVSWCYVLYCNAYGCNHNPSSNLDRVCAIITSFTQALMCIHEADHVLLPFLGIQSNIFSKAVLLLSFISGFLIDVGLFGSDQHIESNYIKSVGAARLLGPIGRATLMTKTAYDKIKSELRSNCEDCIGIDDDTSVDHAFTSKS